MTTKETAYRTNASTPRRTGTRWTLRVCDPAQMNTALFTLSIAAGFALGMVIAFIGANPAPVTLRLAVITAILLALLLVCVVTVHREEEEVHP